MQNFHFNPTSNRSVHLMKQYDQMTRQLEDKKKLLQKKNLELQFYQDPTYVNAKKQPVASSNSNNNAASNQPKNRQYQNLADQIMNDLLFQNKSKKVQPTYNNGGQNYQAEMPKQRIQQNNNNLYQNMNNFNPVNQFQGQYSTNDNTNNNSRNNNNNNSNNIDNTNNSYPILQNNQQQPQFVPRQNNFIQQNKRELDKQRLQNPNLNEEYPFLSKAQPVKRSIQTRQQKPIINQRQLQKQKLQQQSSAEQNPFWGQNRNNRSQQRNNNTKNQPNYQQYENIRQKEKEKLQQQLHNNRDFDIYQRPTSPTQMPAQKDTQGQNVSKKAAFQNRYSNPFVKDEEYLKKMREQQQRQYRRALQQQKNIEEERKKMEKLKFKEQKYAFNSYEPGAVNNPSIKQSQQQQIPIKSPSLNMTKKVDPNGKPPVYNYEQAGKKNISSSDMEYMKMKAVELKDSFKKGRIMHDEYLSQVKKLAEYYKVDYRELVDRKALDEGEGQLPWMKEKKQDEGKQQVKVKGAYDQQNDKRQTKQEIAAQRYQIVENQQSLERYPDSQLSLPHNQYSREPSSQQKNLSSDPYSANLSYQPSHGQNYPNSAHNQNIYTQNLSANPQHYGLTSTSFLQQMPGVDYDLMRRMFEEMKAMRTDYTKSLEKEKSFLQETFMKFMANNLLQNQIQNQPQSQSQTHKNTTLSPKQKKQQNILTQNSQQHFSESLDYIEKSLSGIANKIPYYSNSVNRSNISNPDPSFMMGTPQQNVNKKQKYTKNQPVGKSQQTIEQFFSKPYKCKKFKKFSIMVDVSQSSMQIPNVSNFLALKNGKDVLNKLFEEDLMIMKKLQREKDVEKLRNRVDNQLSYGNQQSSYGTQQSSSIQQQSYTNQKVSYGNPPSYANYGDTFSGNKNAEQYVLKTEEKKVVVTTQNNSFEQYENYSRGKERQGKSAHQQNHRTYKKADQSIPENAFIKRDNSRHQDKLPDFADQSDIKARSPIYYSPKLNSQILEQDEYQTAQKSSNQQLLQSEFYGSSVVNKVALDESKQSTNKKYKMKKKDFAYEEQRQSDKKSKSKDKSPSFKQALGEKPSSKEKVQNGGIMDMIKQNNHHLHKYTVSPRNISESPKREQVDIREYSSINSNPPRDEQINDYFSSGNNQSNSNNASYKMPPLVAILNNLSGNESGPPGLQLEKKLSNKFNTQKEELQFYNNEESVEEIKSQNYLDEDRVEYTSSRQQVSRNDNTGRYEVSQEDTVKSIRYSVASSRRPPPSVNISQTVESYEQSASKLMRPPLGRKKSSSRKKQSSIIRTKFEKDSILQKPPPSESQVNSMIKDDDDDIVIGREPLKFDSNVYDSEYDQSVSQKDLQKRISQLQGQQKMRISEPQINVSPPVIASNQSSVLNIQRNESKASSIGGSKLKSLQEARNFAKESKKKSINLTQNDQMFKYEQKMSELQSFLTKRDDSIIRQTKETKTIKLAIQKSPHQKKNIMNLLDDLENQSSYRDDFQSYREESEVRRY